MVDMATLIAERCTLTDKLANCEHGAFPGSAAFWQESKALKALGAFDETHPEVIVEIQRADRERALAGVDILGI